MPSTTSAHSAARRPRVVVVGAGIAGLTAAYAIASQRPDVDVLVLDAARTTGGKLRLNEVAGQQVDVGAEAMLNRRPEAVALAREVGLDDSLVYPETTSAGVWTRGEVRRLPASVMGVPTDLRALSASGVVSARGVARAGLDRVLPARPLDGDVSIGAYVARRLGGEVRDRLVEPLLGGVYAGRADELSLRATVPQLVSALEQNGGLLRAAAASRAPTGSGDPPAASHAPPIPVFAGIDGGVGRLAQAVTAALVQRGVQVRTEVTVRELQRVPTGFRLLTGPTIETEAIDADAVVLAVPATPAARLLREVAPAAATDLAQVEYASMAIVTLAFDSAAGNADLRGSGFLVPPVDGRDIKAATFSSRKWGWLDPGLLVVRCSVGRVGEEQQLQREDADLVSGAVMDLRDAIGLHAPLAGALVTRWGGALPQYAVGHRDRVARIRSAVDDVAGLAVCGAAYDGLGIPACIATGRAAATRIVDHLGARERIEP
jgi:oxygen-dependent protoporphyrinogen oxidase